MVGHRYSLIWSYILSHSSVIARHLLMVGTKYKTQGTTFKVQHLYHSLISALYTNWRSVGVLSVFYHTIVNMITAQPQIDAQSALHEWICCGYSIKLPWCFEVILMSTHNITALIKKLKKILHTCASLTLVLLDPDIPCLCKQCRSRSVGCWRSQLIWTCTVCHSECEFISKIWIK